MKAVVLLSILTVLSGCSADSRRTLDDIYGLPDPARHEAASTSSTARAAWQKATTVLDTRCVVCHACYDAPCQLKLSSREGLIRGGSKERVYALRLLATAPTRLHIDAQTSEQWRRKGFHPVLNERSPSPEADREASVMHRLLDLKRKQPAESGILAADRYDFALDRAQQCPTIEEMDEVEATRPWLGMPYGMPPLTDDEYRTLSEWIRDGAPYAPPPPLSAAHIARVATWETFLNGDSPKERLMARYLYEHWYLAHFHFDDLPRGEYFELVRSSTPPGSPIRIIATARPWDDPGVERVYYRLRRLEETLVVKTHMPYALSAARMRRVRSWFLDADYTVDTLPSYDPDIASNPFVAFQQIPVPSRYRLMLEEAQFTIMGFIKGPVCRGQVALDVINDLFWVTFLDPDHGGSELAEGPLGEALKNLHLPAEDESSLPLLKWRKYSRAETEFLKVKMEALNARLGEDNPPRLEMLWDGDGNNDNAALTIFRHFDSATVVKGFVGAAPQTAWVIGYSLLERIHYLLVAGYDVYGNIGHQVTTRMYMDFLRMEGESNFLTLLPLATRDAVRDHWYRGANEDVKAYLQGDKAYFARETGVRYRTDRPLPELYGLLKKRLSPVLDRRYQVTTAGLPAATRASLKRLADVSGRNVSLLPEVSFLEVTAADGRRRHYTLLHNSAHANISTLLREEKNRLPDEDTVTLVDGFLGAYPNAFHALAANEVPAFVDAIAGLREEADYARLMQEYGIRRTDPRFWPHSDAVHAAFRSSAPLEAGLFDYSRYENR